MNDGFQDVLDKLVECIGPFLSFYATDHHRVKMPTCDGIGLASYYPSCPQTIHLISHQNTTMIYRSFVFKMEIWALLILYCCLCSAHETTPNHRLRSSSTSERLAGSITEGDNDNDNDNDTITEHQQNHRRRDQAQPRIIDGEDAPRGRFPWMVFYSFDNESRFCGGSLIVSRHHE